MDSLFAPAKLTLSLRITDVRNDGYHLIDAEMVTLDFGDDLLIDPEGTDLKVIDDGVGFDLNDLLAPQENLAAKALQLVGRTAGVTIKKRIPAAAGLGGGSADAAAVLRWAGFDDLQQAASIGADVPFCLVGGRARVEGVGEIVTPLTHVDERYTLFTPPIRCATELVYAAWDALGGPAGEGGNDLEAAALEVEPELATWRDELGNRTGATPRLAGSGSTWFVAGEFPGDGHVVAVTRAAEAG